MRKMLNISFWKEAFLPLSVEDKDSNVFFKRIGVMVGVWVGLWVLIVILISIPINLILIFLGLVIGFFVQKNWKLNGGGLKTKEHTPKFEPIRGRMRQEVPTIHNVWFSPRKYGIFRWRQPSRGTLAIQNQILYFRGAKETLKIDNIVDIQHIRMPGDYRRKWIALTYETQEGAKTIYLAQNSQVGLGGIFGGSLNLFNALDSMVNQRLKADAVFLTPIEVEFQAIRKHLEKVRIVEDSGGNVFTYGYFKGQHHNWSVAVVQSGSGERNTTEAALRSANFFSPRIMMLVGVAGGIKDVEIGDIVVGTKGYNYEAGKEIDENFLPRLDFVQHSNRLIERAKYISRSQTWLKRIHTSSDSTANLPKEDINVFFGGIASGSKVLADERSPLVERIKNQFNDVLAVEMEASGLQALNRNYGHIHTLNIRCISDLLDNKALNDARGMQQLAASRAAAFAFELLFVQPAFR